MRERPRLVHESSPVSAEYALGLLNSPVLFWILLRTSNSFRGGWITCAKQYFGELPIRVLNRADERERAFHDLIVHLVEWLSSLHARPSKTENTNPIDPLMAAYFEQWLNALVYELYFPQELHAAGLHFFDLIQAETLPQLHDLGGADPLPQLRKLFQQTYASDHQLRQALYRLGSLDLVRTIEGKA
jgi:adenine-specific DNA-methyltransferase